MHRSPPVSVFLAFVLSSAAFAAPAPQADPPEPVENAPNYVALNAPQRWQRFGNETLFNPGIYFAALGSAVGSQLSNRPPEWHQGLKGYARRSASQLGVFTVQATIREGAAAALGYEPRYVRSSSKGFLPRFGHAVQWTFLTMDKNGHRRFNIPAVGAAYGSGMISTAWYPDRFSVLHDGVRNGNQQMGVAVGVSVLREFAPELKRFFHWKL